ncbi:MULTISPECIES: lipocalin family protein [Chryseobacterium]|uniref:lipocalin family protein n=1 Tax=Chryseobacterium TaxID=59732 RepID=UPI0012EFA9F5|nr:MULTISPECIES: lipocalin family protein [Chryseobacterium]VXA96551.1 Lipocalin-like domain-containing protein [Chryseobacterium sp. 8AT]
MKKLALFAGLSLLAFTGCNDDDAPEQIFPLVGTWSPTQEVRTQVPADGVGFSDQIAYTDCQKESRWVFNENSSGKRTNRDMAGTVTPTCSTISERNFTYVYNSSEKNFEIKYQGTVVSDKGKVTLLNAETLNLKIEDTTDPTIYKSTTYTFKRIPQ